MLSGVRKVIRVLTASVLWLSIHLKVYACEDTKVIRIREDGIQTIYEDIISMIPILWRQMLPTCLALICTGMILALVWKIRPEKQ